MLTNLPVTLGHWVPSSLPACPRPLLPIRDACTLWRPPPPHRPSSFLLLCPRHPLPHTTAQLTSPSCLALHNSDGLTTPTPAAPALASPPNSRLVFQLLFRKITSPHNLQLPDSYLYTNVLDTSAKLFSNATLAPSALHMASSPGLAPPAS